MSKERARLRAQRQLVAEEQRRERERRRRRRQRLRALAAGMRRLVPRLPDRRSGRLPSGRTRAQRTALVGAVATVLTLIWVNAEPLSTRIALTLLVVVITPVVAILVLDRRN